MASCMGSNKKYLAGISLDGITHRYEVHSTVNSGPAYKL